MKYINCIGLEFNLYCSPSLKSIGTIEGTPFLNTRLNEYYNPLVDYFIMLDYYYIGNILNINLDENGYLQNKYLFANPNNIDGWLWFIDKQIFSKSNEDYYGDNVCVFFKENKVKLINYRDYEAGKNNYCELTVDELRKLTIEWKWFVIEWERQKFLMKK